MIAAEGLAAERAHAVRSVRLDDAPEIARLATELGYPNDADAMRARLAELAAWPGHWVGVAAARAQGLAGWVHVARCSALETGPYAEILGLVVDARNRRGGVGRALVWAAEGWARDAGVTRITVRSNALRVESHRFYPALEYARAKSQHVYVKMLKREACLALC